MVKQNMSTLDVAGEVACLRARIQGMWVINIYDVSAKTYLLKLGTSGEGGEKVFLVMESGSRFHTTQYDRGRKDFPSNFCIKLRKHIRDRRLSNVQQLGIDRIVDFTFGHGDKSVHLILELYAQGNLVLADSNYEVLTLLRSHRDDGKGYALMPRHPYPVHAIRLAKPLTLDILKEKLFESKEGTNLKNVVNSAFPYGLPIAEHCIRQALAALPQEGPTDASCLSGDEVTRIFTAMKQIEEWVKNCWDNVPEGILYYKGSQTDEANAIFEDFMPMSLEQNKERNSVQFPTFDAALDEYFSRIEGQKAEAVSAQAERSAVSRVEKAKIEQEKRAVELHKAAELAENQAAAVELSMDTVDAAITAVNEVLATGMDWPAVESLIKDETEAGNPVAGIIHSLQLDKNTIAVLLEDPTSTVEEPSENRAQEQRKKPKKIKVSLNLGLSAYGNASTLYSLKKENVRKERRTQEVTKIAVEASESKAQAKMKQKQKAVVELHHMRKPLWFEKFNWFISSENYLVISGRDAQQNELVVKKYMGKDDLYVHADVHGASSTIIKNHRQGRPVPPLTLEQAGVACICRSKAWDGKIVTSAWWVFAQQVSQTAPTGEYLTTGSFMIHGKKNFLPPSSLVYGFGFMFKLDDSCLEAHRGERGSKNIDSDGSESGEQSRRTSKQSEELPSPPDESVVETVEAEKVDSVSNAESALDSFLDAATDYLAKPLPIAQQAVVTDDAHAEEDDVPGPDELEERSVDSYLRPSSKKRMSKKERNERKQGKNGSARPDDTAEDAPVKKDSSSPVGEPESSPVPIARPKPRPKSGRSGRSKLDEWDEEDRLLMMQFMGANGEKKSKSSKRAERKQKQAAKRSEKASNTLNSMHGRDLTAEMQDTISKAKEIPFTSSEDPVAAAENPDADPVINQDFSSHEEDQDTEEVDEQLEGIDHGLVQVLDGLTGCPRPDDILLFALPVCAPYDTMLSYKFKVKLTPGTLKKGKAAKQAMELLTRVGEALPAEVQLMKGAPDTSLMHVLLSSVMINMPGMQKIRQAKKRSKKGRK